MTDRILAGRCSCGKPRGWNASKRVAMPHSCKGVGPMMVGIHGTGTGVVARKQPDGQRHETALYAAFREAGYIDAVLYSRRVGACSTVGFIPPWFIRHGCWGDYLAPRRGFASDAMFPVERLLVECDGGAHAAGRAKVKSDTERRGLAAAAGWRCLCVTPEQVHDGRAIQLVREALNAR